MPPLNRNLTDFNQRSYNDGFSHQGMPQQQQPGLVQGQDMLSLFMQAMQQHNMQQDALAQQRLQLQNQQTFGRHLDMGGQPITGDQSPWSGPIKFQSAQERLGEMTNSTGAYAHPTTFNPFDLQGMQQRAHAMQPAPVAQPNPMAFNPTTIPNPGGGFQGMNNTGLPDGQKFQDANMFTAKPGVSSLRPGNTIGDEKGQYGTDQPKKKTGRPGSYFNGMLT